jgi:hypothetical protein
MFYSVVFKPAFGLETGEPGKVEINLTRGAEPRPLLQVRASRVPLKRSDKRELRGADLTVGTPRLARGFLLLLKALGEVLTTLLIQKV